MVAALFLLTAGAQNYQFDNTIYTTIDWNEFFSRLEKNTRLVFFDIRTAGERNDTSQYTENNQGRIRGALQADYYEIEKYYPEFLKHKEDTIYLYCSHSMRSRRLAKRLSDSLFKHVVSINGGMSYLNLMGNKGFPLRKKYYETDLKYQLISPFEFGAKLKNNRVQVMDIRPDSIYYGTGGDEQDKSYGFIKGVKHIAVSKLKDSLSILDQSKGIILIDNYGDISREAARLLLENGFSKTGILLFGLNELRNTVPSYQRNYLHSNYSSILPSELIERKKTGGIVLLDIRTESEFNGTDSVEWKNTGRLKGAVNIPFASFSEKKMRPYKNKKIVLYDNMMMPPELYRSADLLKQYGFKDVVLLSGGVFQLNWEIANTGKKYLAILLDKK